MGGASHGLCEGTQWRPPCVTTFCAGMDGAIVLGVVGNPQNTSRITAVACLDRSGEVGQVRGFSVDARVSHELAPPLPIDPDMLQL